MMEETCIFCQIIAGKLPASILHRDGLVTAFRDAHPIAPVHILVVPNIHIRSINEVTEENEGLLGRLITVAKKLALENGVDQSGYRLVLNTGAHAGQSIWHVHLHLLGGRHLPFHFQEHAYPVG
jgi:histidine triad (HIT) family protein